MAGLRESARCEVWGVLNVTDDSFSDGGQHLDPEVAIRRGHELSMLGADVIDVGGESTRPAGQAYGSGYRAISAAEEIDRVGPVIERLSSAGHRISVDTSKGAVAAESLRLGATIVNDVSGGADDALLEAVASAGADLVLMHNRGRGEVDARNTEYDDVVQEVIDELDRCCARAEAAGVAPERLVIDPGIGFAKTAVQSATLIAATSRFAATGRRVLVGPSRKSFIAALAKNADGTSPSPLEREAGTAAAITVAVLGGASAVRVHDVGAMRQAVVLAEAMRQFGQGTI